MLLYTDRVKCKKPRILRPRPTVIDMIDEQP